VVSCFIPIKIYILKQK